MSDAGSLLKLRKDIFNRRITLFTGHFGSGKSEIALNFALEMKKYFNKVSFADIDIVNPYFRSADASNYLKEAGIKFIKTLFAGTNVDIPALSPEMNALFEDEDEEARLILDVGGDDLGAKAVSRYRHDIMSADNYAAFLVVNIKRPITSTPADIVKMLAEIEGSARIKITGLVNNTNLLRLTKPEDMMDGHEILKMVSSETGIPIAFAAGIPEAFTGIEDIIMNETTGGVLTLDRMIRLPWDARTHKTEGKLESNIREEY